VFFSFPHVAINASGELGKISREGRHDSHACGALLKVQKELQKQETINASPGKEGSDYGGQQKKTCARVASALINRGARRPR
jgi:hypothetical protein